MDFPHYTRSTSPCVRGRQNINPFSDRNNQCQCATHNPITSKWILIEVSTLTFVHTHTPQTHSPFDWLLNIIQHLASRMRTNDVAILDQKFGEIFSRYFGVSINTKLFDLLIHLIFMLFRFHWRQCHFKTIVDIILTLLLANQIINHMPWSFCFQYTLQLIKQTVRDLDLRHGKRKHWHKVRFTRCSLRSSTSRWKG